MEKNISKVFALLTSELLNLRRRVSVLEKTDPDLDEEKALEVIAETLEISKAEVYALLKKHRG